MKPLNNYILPLLSLLLCMAHQAFALNAEQALTSDEPHFLTVQEYVACLSSVATTEDLHQLYGAEKMSGEILKTVSFEDQQPHFTYLIVDSIDLQSPMLGLTKLDAMRCCNWIETSLPSNDSLAPSTEVGSYILHEDGTFEVNHQAQLHLIDHNNGTFEIVSSATKATTPLMMWGAESRHTSQNDSCKFPSLEGRTRDNRGRETAPAPRTHQASRSLLLPNAEPDNVFAMNITVQPLANILHNDCFEDDSLIGHSGLHDKHGTYLAIKDPLWCIPEVVKDCFRSETTRQQLIDARNKIRDELSAAMRADQGYQSQQVHSAGYTRLPISLSTTDDKRIKSNIQEFNQFFNDHKLTKGTLAQFCQEHQITVHDPFPTAPRASRNTPSSNQYGSVDLGNRGTQAVQNITGSIRKVYHQYWDSNDDQLEYAPDRDHYAHERTPFNQGPQVNHSTDSNNKSKRLANAAVNFAQITTQLREQRSVRSNDQEIKHESDSWTAYLRGER